MENKILNDYDKVSWGISIETVKNIYPELDYIHKMENGIKLLSNSKLIEEQDYHLGKIFKFFNNELYGVEVIYFIELNSEFYGFLINSFQKKYGQVSFVKAVESKPNETLLRQILEENNDPETIKEMELYLNDSYDSTKIMVKNISSEMKILIYDTITIIKSKNEKMNHHVRFKYLNPKILDRIQENNFNKKK